MKSKYYRLILIFALLTTCKAKDSNTKPQFEIDTTTWITNEVIQSSTIKDLFFKPLETRNECILTNISKLIPGKEKVYIFDSSQPYSIFIFSKEGKYLKKVGKSGRGPGEITRLRDFDIDELNDRLIILDSYMKKLMLYKISDGTFINEIKLPFSPGSFVYLGNEIFSFYLLDVYSKMNDYSIVNFNLKTKSVINLKKRDEYDLNISGHSLIYKSANVYYVPYLNEKLYQVSQDNIFQKIHFNFGENKIPENELKEYRLKKMNILSLLKNSNLIYGLENVFENQNHISLCVKFKINIYNIIYNKKSNFISYGNRYSGMLENFGLMVNKAVDGDYFISIIDGFNFNRFKNKINLKYNTDRFYKDYVKVADTMNLNSNPVMVFLKYK